MQRALSRRRLISQAAAAGAATVALGGAHFGAALAHGAPTSAPAGTPPRPTTFVRGTVRANAGDHAVLEHGPATSLIRVSAHTPIWRGGPSTPRHIRPGDSLAVAGETLPDGSVRAWRVWVNVPAHVLGTRW